MNIQVYGERNVSCRVINVTNDDEFDTDFERDREKTVYNSSD